MNPGETMNRPMPVLFVGHGNPMNAIEDNEFSRAWEDTARSLPTPTAVVCVSAHWETSGTRVTAMERPRTIHDFSGFPRELFEVAYRAPGSPELAKTVQRMLGTTDVQPDLTWGLDHGTWSVLTRMFPRADVPVIQLSLDRTQGPRFHYDLGRQLAPLRRQGVLLLGSGNVVHNLRLMVWGGAPLDWATEFDRQVRRWIEDDDHQALIEIERQGPSAALAVNSGEHYLPLLYALAAKEKGETIRFFCDTVWGGAISMRSLRIG